MKNAILTLTFLTMASAPALAGGKTVCVSKFKGKDAGVVQAAMSKELSAKGLKVVSKACDISIDGRVFAAGGKTTAVAKIKSKTGDTMGETVTGAKGASAASLGKQLGSKVSATISGL